MLLFDFVHSIEWCDKRSVCHSTTDSVRMLNNTENHFCIRFRWFDARTMSPRIWLCVRCTNDIYEWRSSQAVYALCLLAVFFISFSFVFSVYSAPDHAMLKRLLHLNALMHENREPTVVRLLKCLYELTQASTLHKRHVELKVKLTFGFCNNCLSCHYDRLAFVFIYLHFLIELLCQCRILWMSIEIIAFERIKRFLYYDRQKFNIIFKVYREAYKWNYITANLNQFQVREFVRWARKQRIN